MNTAKARGMNRLVPGGLSLLLSSVLPLSASPPAGPAPGPATSAVGWVTPIPPYPAAARVLREQGRTALLVRTGPDGGVGHGLKSG